MQNSLVMLTILSEQKYYFWVSLVQKIKNCLFKLKFGTWNNLNLQNSMVMFTLFVFDSKYPFFGNLFQKLKLLAEA